VVESGDAVNERYFAVAYDEQANKNNPTRRSRLVVKDEKEIYRREKHLSVVYLKECMVVFRRAKS
jgi:hypothetical protein